MEWAQNQEKERNNPQMGMFGSSQRSRQSSGPRLPEVDEWPESQKLLFEKETLGFYLTGHPLTRYVDKIQRLASTDTQRIKEAGDGREVVIGGVVNNLKEINTKKGDRMAFVTLEDLNGVVEVIVFTELYKSSALLLKGEDPIFIKGKVDAGEESVKIIASEILPFEKAAAKLTTSVHMRVKCDGLGREDLIAMREIFTECRGDYPAYLHLLLPDHQEAVLNLGDEWKLDATDRLMSRMKDLLGYEAVTFQA